MYQNADYETSMARRLIIADVMRNWGFTNVYVIISVVRLIEWGRSGGKVVNVWSV